MKAVRVNRERTRAKSTMDLSSYSRERYTLSLGERQTASENNVSAFDRYQFLPGRDKGSGESQLFRFGATVNRVRACHSILYGVAARANAHDGAGRK